MVPETAVLLISCPDQKGLVACVSDFIFRNGGNIVHADQHIDPQQGVFFQRVEWELGGFTLAKEKIGDAFREIAGRFQMQWRLRFSSSLTRMAIFVSKYDHCLLDLLHSSRTGDLPGEIAVVVSNHPDLEPIVASFGIPFHVFPITAENKCAQEELELKLLAELRVDLVVLARYMQILTPHFLEIYPNLVINIHHSFLPAFIGKKPYHQAYERGVKLIGATCHYVTEDLDEGPIIEQDVARVSHEQSVDDLVRLGKDVEKTVLARGLRNHLEDRVLVYGNKTIVF